MRSNISTSCYEYHPTSTYARHLLNLEISFDFNWSLFWFYSHWKLCYPIIVCYLAAILGLKTWMQPRKPLQLRSLLFLWNLALAIFSICATLRVVPAMVYNVLEQGTEQFFCSFGSQQHRQSYSVWAFLFAFSKVVELGDTVFIVLRKTPLIFLHVYHHVSVLFFVWSCSAYPSVMQIYFMVMNVFVHSFMYSYYALKVLRVPIPKTCCMAITLLQLLQMAFGVVLIAGSYLAFIHDAECCVFEQALIIGVVIYSSYFVLFLNFFMKAYLSKKSVWVVLGISKKTQ